MRVRMLPLAFALAACPRATPPIAEPTAPPASPQAAAAASPFDAAIADMVGECGPVLESADSTEPPTVDDRRVDLDRDGVAEAIVHVSCEDLSQWKVLALRGDEAVVLHERMETSTSLTPLVDPQGTMVIVVEHQCCCMYELDVLAMNGDALVSRFEWGSGCSDGCDDSLRYSASVSTTDDRLTGISIPVGECGADGSADVDLARWKLSG